MAARVRGDEQHRVRRLQVGRGEVEWVTGRRGGDRRLARLLLVEERQRSAARPPGQHDLLVAEAPLGVRDRLAEVDHHLLHDQRGVVAVIAAVAIDHVHPRAGQRLHERQERAPADRMHEDHDGVALHVARDDPVRLEEHHPAHAAVGVLEGRVLGKQDRVDLVSGLVPSSSPPHVSILSSMGGGTGGGRAAALRGVANLRGVILEVFDVLVAVYGSFMAASGLLQAERVHRRRSSEDVSEAMVSVMLIGSGLWLAYGLVHGQVVVVVANAAGVVSWAITLWVVRRWRIPKVDERELLELAGDPAVARDERRATASVG